MRIDKRFLARPRNGGSTLKYKLPKELQGQPDPKTGKPMGKTLHLGHGTSDLREAAHRRRPYLTRPDGPTRRPPRKPCGVIVMDRQGQPEGQ